MHNGLLYLPVGWKTRIIREQWLIDKDLKSSHGICALVLLLEFVFLPILITWPNILSQASADRISWHPLVDIKTPEPTIYLSYCTFRKILTQKVFLVFIFYCIILAEIRFWLREPDTLLVYCSNTTACYWGYSNVFRSECWIKSYHLSRRCSNSGKSSSNFGLKVFAFGFRFTLVLYR